MVKKKPSQDSNFLEISGKGYQPKSMPLEIGEIHGNRVFPKEEIGCSLREDCLMYKDYASYDLRFHETFKEFCDRFSTSGFSENKICPIYDIYHKDLKLFEEIFKNLKEFVKGSVNPNFLKSSENNGFKGCTTDWDEIRSSNSFK
ncbi:MAG: hypothetical protein WC812_02160 [Candidatus Pacearchaeota archaeon]|jgi:hypothetical protein